MIEKITLCVCGVAALSLLFAIFFPKNPKKYIHYERLYHGPSPWPSPPSVGLPPGTVSTTEEDGNGGIIISYTTPEGKIQ